MNNDHLSPAHNLICTGFVHAFYLNYNTLLNFLSQSQLLSYSVFSTLADGPLSPPLLTPLPSSLPGLTTVLPSPLHSPHHVLPSPLPSPLLLTHPRTTHHSPFSLLITPPHPSSHHFPVPPHSPYPSSLSPSLPLLTTPFIPLTPPPLLTASHHSP